MNLNAMTAADVQIQLVEREKAQALADVETALKRQADLQVMAKLVLPREGWGTTPPTPTPHFPPPPLPYFMALLFNTQVQDGKLKTKQESFNYINP